MHQKGHLPMREQRTDSLLPAQSPGRASSSPAERSLRARLAAHTLHARREARQTTAIARAGFLARFEREVDPDSALDPTERRRRAEHAEHARRAYFIRLSLAAVQAKRAKRAAQQAGGDAP
jgi:hypothetical protein